jgi:tRNA pseudouridine55 synthase
MRDVHGILLLDKPLGMTSAGAVARAKRLFDARKAGHTGSLDPLASGLLPICFGEATKFGALLLDADKTYRVVARLGARTASADLESPVIERRELPPLSRVEIERMLAEFPRDYDQVPPMHSALKQEGKPLYEYARQGLTRIRAARRVRIHALEALAGELPDLHFRVRCSKGAYIRVLAEDIALRLGTIAHVTALRRLGVAPFEAAALHGFEQLESLDAAQRAATLLPVDAALLGWPRLDLPEVRAAAFRQGRSVEVPEDACGTLRVYAQGRGFMGLGEVQAAGLMVPVRLTSAAANGA